MPLKKITLLLAFGSGLIGLLTATLVQPAASYQVEPTVTPTQAAGLEGQLQQVPIMPTVNDHVREIYARGLELGNHPHIFSKVGDCNSADPDFLTLIDTDNYDLGAYSYLQETVDFFAGSFGRYSHSAHGGFNFTAIVDPFSSDPTHCALDESPLQCEYNKNKPSIAFIMFGSNDLHDLSNESFTRRLEQIIQESLDYGVIPVLSTFTRHRDGFWNKTLEYNMITVEMAEKYDLPLINFWLAAQSLPDYGLKQDTMHLTKDGYLIQFNGQENVGGHDLRNLLVLQVLDMFRTELGMDE